MQIMRILVYFLFHSIQWFTIEDRQQVNLLLKSGLESVKNIGQTHKSL